MTVNISKPAVNVREKLAELDKPTGIAGEAMLRAETPQEQQALIGVGRRNFVINGGFAVDQRNNGAEHTKSGSNYNVTGMDRWGIYYDTTKIQQKVVTIGTQKKYACRFTSGAVSNTTQLYCFTKIESGSAYFSGQHAMLSFWARSNTAKRGSIEFRYYNTAESVGHSNCGSLEQPNFYTEWHYYQIPVVFEEDEDGISHDRYLFVKFGANTADVSASDWMEIADVQLELGKVATPFEHRSYGEELALCQRYYYKWFPQVGYSFINTGYAYQTTSVNIVVPLPQPLRAAPTFSYGGTFRICSGSCFNGVSVGAGNLNPFTPSIQVTSSGLTVGDAYALGDYNNTSSYLAWDAEL